jgi:poly(3-hydroxybutyrate) depolymerase
LVLYSLYEAQHTALAPMRFMAELSRGWFGNPFSPWSYAPFARRLAASSDLFLRVTQRYEKPDWNIEADLEIALDRPFCKLVHFNDGRPKKHKVLVVAPLSGHHATLLRDTVRSLLHEHDVWISDWVDARMVPLKDGPFHLADYVDYVRDWIRLLGPDLHVMSVCQPTVPVLAAISLMASHDEAHSPLTMTMMGGPIDARRSPTAVNNLATRKPYSWFEQNVIHRVPQKYPGFMRQVYPGFLQHLGFVAMNPDRHLTAHWDYFNHLLEGDGDSADAHRRFYDEYNAVLDMPAEYYLDTVKTVFQDFALPKGRMFVREELVRPQAIRKTALLTIEGELDDISGDGQTQAAHALCLNIPAARREHFTAPGVGHYGIFSGRRWREIVFPKVREFIARHS